jgi:hypothetical protein
MTVDPWTLSAIVALAVAFGVAVGVGSMAYIGRVLYRLSSRETPGE